MTNIAINGRHTKLSLPVKSLIEEFKIAKVRSHMKLRNSSDPVMKNV